MDAQTGGVSSFDRAKAAVRKIVERLRPDDRLTLYRVAARTEEVFSRFSADTASIEDRIDSLKLSPSRANFLAAFVQAFGQGRTDRARPRVYLVTDCQAGSWRELSQQTIEHLLPEKAELIVVNVASQNEIANVGIVGNPPPRERAVVGLPLRLVAHVTNYSKSQPADVTLSLLIDDKEVARAAAGDEGRPDRRTRILATCRARRACCAGGSKSPTTASPTTIVTCSSCR